MSLNRLPADSFGPASEPQLSARQRQVLVLIAEGYANEEVGRRLGISTRTARAHSDALRAKLGSVRRRHIPRTYRVLTGRDPLDAAADL